MTRNAGAGGSDLLPAWRSRGSHARQGKTVIEYQLPETGNAGWGAGSGGKYHLKDKRGPEKYAIVGPNRAGKTTLPEKIAAELKEREDLRVDYMPQNS